MSPGGIHGADCELFALSPGNGVATLVGLLGSGSGLANCGERVGLCTTRSGCTGSCVPAACTFESPSPTRLLHRRLFHDVRGDGGGCGESAEERASGCGSPFVRIDSVHHGSRLVPSLATAGSSRMDSCFVRPGRKPNFQVFQCRRVYGTLVLVAEGVEDRRAKIKAAD